MSHCINETAAVTLPPLVVKWYGEEVCICNVSKVLFIFYIMYENNINVCE